MSTYSYDITTEIGQVRRLIDDTDIVPTSDAWFSDEEIQFFLNLGGSVLMAAAKALEAAAATLMDATKEERIGDYTYKKSTVDNMLKLADKYAKQDASTPYLTWAEMDLASIGETPVVET